MEIQKLIFLVSKIVLNMDCGVKKIFSENYIIERCQEKKPCMFFDRTKSKVETWAW